ncbi:hypothetical protein [Paenibacillus sp. FSL W7-1332]|uniref:hypothetical protein n=1 Tax=Paenibacillus sp. FSL W7-1332 TaxID=2921702 RepID=UPI0030CFCCC2
MTNPVTPNIGLNKIDRTSPSTTYFDLEKYIDQNADAVDRFAGESSEAIHALEKRLDTEERREVVLQPGLQIVNAERSAPFKLSGIKGRTLVNLLGRDGDCESISGWTHNTSTISIDASNKVYGSNSLKVTVISGGNGQGTGYRQIAHLIDRSRYYVAVVDVKSAMGAKSRLVLEVPGKINVDGTPVTDTENFYPSFLRIKPSDIEGTGNLVLHGLIRGSVGDVSYFDGFRIYEITHSEYNKLGAMTAAQVAAKYPYVDSVQPVRNPYAIRYGENLLPPFYEWGHINNKGKILSPYSYLQPEYDAGTWTNISILVKPFTDYTLSFESVGGVRIRIIDNKTSFSVLLDLTNTGGTFNSGNNTTVSVYIDAGIVGQVNNPMLTLGNTPKPFKPRKDTMLALHTDLYADPLTGANADEVFEKDGQYFKLAKWKKIVLDGSTNYTFYSSSGIAGLDFKVMRLDIQNAMSKNDNDDEGRLYVQKYDGKLLSILDTGVNATWTTGDLTRIWDNFLYLSIPNTDSGWGNNYTPTTDEIKAYFMGWRMFDGTIGASTLYNRTDGSHKSWVRIIDWLGKVDNAVPTMQAPNWTPYQLVYQLATPKVEPIVSEGTLTFNKGDNKIEVGTGLVVRENAKPSKDANNVWNIGNPVANPTSQGFKYKAKNVIAVYKNSLQDNGWVQYVTDEYGALIQEKQPNTIYDPSAAYSTTYLMLDKSPIVPVNGSYAANEIAVLEELTEAVQQNATAVSVLMNKKVDKDNSVVWVKPTLINGATEYPDTNFRKPSYTKIGNWVKLSGLIKVTVSGTMFYLPPGYRPNKVLIFAGLSGGIASYSMMDLRVTPTGNVTVNTTSPLDWLSLDHIIFLAEQ